MKIKKRQRKKKNPTENQTQILIFLAFDPSSVSSKTRSHDRFSSSQRKITFVTSSLLSCTLSPLKRGVYSVGKEFSSLKQILSFWHNTLPTNWGKNFWQRCFAGNHTHFHLRGTIKLDLEGYLALFFTYPHWTSRPLKWICYSLAHLEAEGSRVASGKL